MIRFGSTYIGAKVVETSDHILGQSLLKFCCFSRFSPLLLLVGEKACFVLFVYFSVQLHAASIVSCWLLQNSFYMHKPPHYKLLG